MTPDMSGVLWFEPASPMMFHAGGFQLTEALVFVLPEILFDPVVNVDELSVSWPRRISDVAPDPVSSVLNCMYAFVIVEPCGIFMFWKRIPTV